MYVLRCVDLYIKPGGFTYRLEEAKRYRTVNEKLKARNEALTELLECAAKGGHVTAQTIMEVLQQYKPWEDTHE